MEPGRCFLADRMPWGSHAHQCTADYCLAVLMLNAMLSSSP